MQARNVSFQEMNQALEIVNKKYDGNIEFKRLEWRGKKIIFTLKVKDNKGLGTALNVMYKLKEIRGDNLRGQPKHSGSASWYAHGYFYEELLKISPKAVINSTLKGKSVSIDINGGNWQNPVLGSPYYGWVNMSELADNEPE